MHDMATIWPSSRSLLDLLTLDRTGLNRGRVEALLRRGKGFAVGTGGRGDDQFPNSVVTFLQDLADAMADGDDPVTFQHPRDIAWRKPYYPVNSGVTELTPVDLAWLQRLPQNPSAISYDDAVGLAGLALHDWPIGSPSRRLVEAAWHPVEEVYDERKAADDLKQARKPLWRVPNAAAAISDVILHEVPHLEPAEALTRAGRLIDAKLAERRERHDVRLAEAHAAVAEIEARTARRTSTTAPARG